MFAANYVICTITIALLFFSGAYGEELTVTVSEGNSASSIISTSTFGAAANNAVEQAITIDPNEVTGKNALYAEGDYSTSRSVYGWNGGYCESGFSVSGWNAETYYDFWADGSNYAQLEEWLSASNANSIYAYGNAYSNYGYASGSTYAYSDRDQAQASYYNYAYADPWFAYDYQDVGSAIGDYANAVIASYNYDNGDYTSSTVYASSYSDYYPAMIWNAQQYSYSDSYSTRAATTQGNAWANDGEVGQNNYASNYYDYAGAYQYGYNSLMTSLYNVAEAGGSSDYVSAYGSAYVYGYPTNMGAYAYNYWYDDYASDYDYSYGWYNVYEGAYTNYYGDTNAYAGYW